MVRLFNIHMDNHTIACDYEPEKSNQYGHVSVSIDSQEIVNSQYSEYKYGKNFYLSCVYTKLIQLLRTEGNIPSETFAICF